MTRRDAGLRETRRHQPDASPSGPIGDRKAWASAPETLRALYDRYCQVERSELLALLPREGLRSLWRHRRASLAEGPLPTASIEGLREAAASLLPLPPYDVWLRSYLADRRPYLTRLGIPAAPSRAEPVTVSTRELAPGLWVHLNLVHRTSGWAGFLGFHGPDVPAGLRTTEVFRGGDPDEMRERFEHFRIDTLRAFHRSVSE